METRLTGNKSPLGDPELLRKRKAWKAGLIDVLKNSPSKDRKFLRWNFVQIEQSVYGSYVRKVVGTGELEVPPKLFP